jgi:hypothetical protein
MFNCCGAISTSFYCKAGCKFLDTLANDGYDGFLRTTSQEEIERLQNGTHEVLKSAPISTYCTGFIYFEPSNTYFKVTVENQGEMFEVDVERCDNVGERKDALQSAICAMCGKK